MHGETLKFEKPLTCWQFCPEPEKEGGMFFRTRAPHRRMPTALPQRGSYCTHADWMAVIDFDSLVGASDLLRT